MTEAAKNETARGLPHYHVGKDVFDEDSDDSVANHSCAIGNMLLSFRPRNIIKIACIRWRGLSKK